MTTICRFEGEIDDEGECFRCWNWGTDGCCGPILIVVLASSASALRRVAPTHTVEAEWGDEVVEGSVLTLAHHSSREGQPAPCLYRSPGHTWPKVALVGVSHLDLDTIGGIIGLMGIWQELLTREVSWMPGEYPRVGDKLWYRRWYSHH